MRRQGFGYVHAAKLIGTVFSDVSLSVEACDARLPYKPQVVGIIARKTLNSLSDGYLHLLEAQSVGQKILRHYPLAASAQRNDIYPAVFHAAGLHHFIGEQRVFVAVDVPGNKETYIPWRAVAVGIREQSACRRQQYGAAGHHLYAPHLIIYKEIITFQLVAKVDKAHCLPFRRATACLVDDVQSAVKRGNENAPPGVLANVIYVVATDGILVSIVMHIVTLRAIGHEHI